ncbi:MAG: hypothetical protein ACPGWR_27095 [Ardenticatenaceae bacterium]
MRVLPKNAGSPQVLAVAGCYLCRMNKQGCVFYPDHEQAHDACSTQIMNKQARRKFCKMMS